MAGGGGGGRRQLPALSDRAEEDVGYLGEVQQELFQEDEDSDYGSHKNLGKVSPQCGLAGNVQFPDLYQTSNLLFYERFEAYKDYLLGDCKPSEVTEFIADYLERALEPSGWKALWRTDIFVVLVEVTEVVCSSLKAVVRPCEPFLCECLLDCVNEQSIRDLLEVKEHKVPLQELHVVYEESGEYEQTALSIEHLRFFYQNIWRSWDEEEEDYFDYFTRCAEPRLRLHYDILEERIPFEMVSEYHSVLSRCEQVYYQFNNLRNTLSRDSDSDCELDNVSMVEGMKMDGEMEGLKRRLKLIETPLLRYVFCYQRGPGSCSLKRKGPRPTGGRVIHVVAANVSIQTLTCLIRDRLEPESCNQNQEIMFHKDILGALTACFDGDLVLVCPGHYLVYSQICIADSLHVEGYGMPDDIIIEMKGKGDTFVECSGAHVKISNMKLIQHNAVEGIVCVLGGQTYLENCVLQCDTTGITVKKSAELQMKYCDLYGAKGAGVEIYPGSICSLTHTGIHHCRDGILIKDFIDDLHDLHKITLENNIIHNNEGYGVVLVKPGAALDRPGTMQEGESITRSGDNDLDAKVAEDNVVSDTIQLESDEQMLVENEGRPKDYCTPASSAQEDGEHGPSDICIAREDVDGNESIVSELTATSQRKTIVYKKRLSMLGITKADDEQEDEEHGPSDVCIASEDVDGNEAIVSELTATSQRKTIVYKKRLSMLGITKADDEQEDEEHGPSDVCIASEDVDGNEAIVSELTATSQRKTMVYKKRLSMLGITKADDEQIMSQEVFVSIANNQFKRNGKGSFGFFLF
ncbi:SHC SH2 domain-binding protein 1 [Phyllobates terribilis]|uniref:SHC SH2 domain-binding protein 1 n=1 Tax=Phyllobates terribilis TaxID=111132 RepID=UPI003CCB6DC7